MKKKASSLCTTTGTWKGQNQAAASASMVLVYTAPRVCWRLKGIGESIYWQMSGSAVGSQFLTVALCFWTLASSVAALVLHLVDSMMKPNLFLRTSKVGYTEN